MSDPDGPIPVPHVVREVGPYTFTAVWSDLSHAWFAYVGTRSGSVHSYSTAVYGPCATPEAAMDAAECATAADRL